MSDIAIIVPANAEQLVVQFLLVQDELADLEHRVYTELPSSKDFPAARVHQFNDLQVSGPALWLIRYSLQIDVWGGPKALTRSIADTMRAVLVARLVGTHEQGVVTGVDVGGLDSTADDSVTTELGKARPRCRFDADVWAHPAPVVIGS